MAKVFFQERNLFEERLAYLGWRIFESLQSPER